MRADNHSVTECWVTLFLPERGASEGHALIEGAVVPDLSRLADHDAHPMIDENALADACAGVNFDAGQHPTDMRGEPPGEQPEPPTHHVTERR